MGLFKSPEQKAAEYTEHWRKIEEKAAEHAAREEAKTAKRIEKIERDSAREDERNKSRAEQYMKKNFPGFVPDSDISLNQTESIAQASEQRQDVYQIFPDAKPEASSLDGAFNNSSSVRNPESYPPPSLSKYPILAEQHKVKPNPNHESDPHPPEYYEGDRGPNYPVLPPQLQTKSGPGYDIRPPGYHTGGPGPYMPPQFRVPKGPFGK